MIRLHCTTHQHHNVDHLQAAQIVMVLAAELAELYENPPDPVDEEIPPCPIDMLAWADGGPYTKYVETRLVEAGIAQFDDEGVLVLAPVTEKLAE